MFSIIISIIVSLLVPQGYATISGDFNCTQYNGTAFVYSPSAVACSNFISDTSCSVLYPAADVTQGYPTAAGNQQRPLLCYTTAAATPAAIVQDIKGVAIRSCPKTCGFCCLTEAYSCNNVPRPRLNCNTITTAQCLSPAWRPIIATDCPSSCGLCNENGCVDAIVDCANDPSICNTVGMQQFVLDYCRRTCGLC